MAAWGKRKAQDPGAVNLGTGEDDPLHVYGDAASMLPRRDADYMVIEIVDASRHSVAAIAKAMSQPSEPREALEKLSKETQKLRSDGGFESNRDGQSSQLPAECKEEGESLTTAKV